MKSPVQFTVSHPASIRVRRRETGRRSFLHSGVRGILAAALAPQFLPGTAWGAQAPSRKITLGCIGLGTHGHGVNLMAFLQQDDCRVTAVCDVFADRRERSRQTVDDHYHARGCAVHADFRELIARDDLDVVVISTPDHWHVPMALRALAAGKKVFCEKPTLTIAEGRLLADTVRQRGSTFATGLEDRSVIHYHKMAEAVRNGAIGKLRHIAVGLPTSKAFPAEPSAPVPDGLNYDLWLGPAAERPYSPSLTQPSVWRQIRDFSGGTLTDWGAHLMDTAQVANFAEDSGPVTVEGQGAIPPNSLNSVPLTYALQYTYANGVTMEVKSDVPSIRFEGSEGWVGNRGWRGQLEASDLDIYRRVYDPATNRIWPRPANEHRDFLDAIRDRRPPTYTADALHRLSTAMHLGSIAIQLGRRLHWDPVKERFDDPAANALLTRPARTSWER
jgi:predicted dehydrogenase